MTPRVTSWSFCRARARSSGWERASRPPRAGAAASWRLSLERQRGVPSSPTRRIILATNVAETSLTIPASWWSSTAASCGAPATGMAAPISRYCPSHTTARPALGPCWKTWSVGGYPLVEPMFASMHAHHQTAKTSANWCSQPQRVVPVRSSSSAFLDPPKPHAVQDASARCKTSTPSTALLQPSQLGHKVVGLPVDAHLGRLLVESQTRASTSHFP